MEEEEKKLTDISRNFRPMAVQWREHTPSYIVVNGESVRYEHRVVALLFPCTVTRRATYLIDLTPIQGLKLLDWLLQERETLERLALMELDRERMIQEAHS